MKNTKLDVAVFVFLLFAVIMGLSITTLLDTFSVNLFNDNFNFYLNY